MTRKKKAPKVATVAPDPKLAKQIAEQAAVLHDQTEQLHDQAATIDAQAAQLSSQAATIAGHVEREKTLTAVIANQAAKIRG